MSSLREGYRGHTPETPTEGTGQVPPMERSKPTQGPSRGEGAPALLGWGKPAGVGLAGKAGGDASNSPNVSSASVVGLAVRRYKKLGVTYRTTNYETVVRLVAELLFRVSRVARGSVVYVNAGKLVRYLGLGGPIHPIDLSVIYSLMEELGFEVVEASRGKAVIINMGHPLIEEVRNAENIDEVVEIIKKYLGE